MSYLQAIVIAVIQGVTELFPVSSLGHSVLVPAWIGGSWHTLVTQSSQSSSEHSFYLTYIVALHCATALALLWFFRLDWVRIVKGLLRIAARLVRTRKLEIVGRDERLGWMILLATIPVGITGLALEHVFRTIFAKPLAAAVFLVINGVILLAAERARRNVTPAPVLVDARPIAREETIGGRTIAEIRAARRSDERITALSLRDAVFVGLLQVGALCAGISRSGITMAGGLWRGLEHEDAARFAFLLATPAILGAGFLKLPTLAGSAGAHIHGQVIVGAIITAIAAYLSVRFLVRYFHTRTLTPFAIYCLIVGGVSVIRFAA